jgi:hypothetical protein
MLIILGFVVVAVLGGGFGYALKAGAIKTELADWRTRLDATLSADAASAKADVAKVASEIKAKL